MLLGAALIWGAAFVAQSVGMDHVGPFTFNGIRNLIGAAVLLPYIYLTGQGGAHAGVRGNRQRRHEEAAAQGQTAGAGSFAGNRAGQKPDAEMLREQRRRERKQLLLGGLVCGVFLCVAGNLQQYGLMYTTVGKAGFITAMYIVLVPLFGLLIGRRIGWPVWLGVFLAVIGLYLLCMTSRLRLGRGDAFVLLGALGFTFQILAVDYFAGKADGAKLACLEFLVCGILTCILMFVFEKPRLSEIYAARIPLLYAGVLSCGVAYTLQIMGQRLVSAPVAALVMSLESVISALSGWLILRQTLSVREAAGCIVLFAAILLAQLPMPQRREVCGERKEIGSEGSGNI